jgi:flagellar protein FlaF
VFRRATGALKAARGSGPIMQSSALSDNRRLWLAVNDLMRDPLNALPQDLRASIVSVGMVVQREMDRAMPDFDFLIAINENIAAGLSSGG